MLNKLILAAIVLTMVAFAQPNATLDTPFQVRYAANLQIGDAVINVTNTGAQGASLFGPGFGGPAGNICVNVYAFSPDEQLISCCSCHLTPNQVRWLSVYNDLTNNTLTGLRPNSVVVKLLATATGGTAAAPTFTGTTCTNSAANGDLAAVTGMAAWGTTLHPFTATVPGGLPAVLTGLYYGVETAFTPSTLSAQERASIVNRCTNIIGNGSTFGLCNSCTLGARGATKL